MLKMDRSIDVAEMQTGDCEALREADNDLQNQLAVI